MKLKQKKHKRQWYLDLYQKVNGNKIRHKWFRFNWFSIDKEHEEDFIIRIGGVRYGKER